MTRSKWFLFLVVLLALFVTSCTDEPGLTDPTGLIEPSMGNPGGEQTPETARIAALIEALYPGPGLENAALTRWANIQRQMSRGQENPAQSQMRALADEVTRFADQGRLEIPDDPLLPPSISGAVTELVTRLFVFVGLEVSDALEDYSDDMPDDFGFGDIDPEEGGTVTTSNTWAAVVAETGETTGTVYVTIELLDEETCAVADPLTQALGCWDINRYPDGAFETDVEVEICVADNPLMTTEEWNLMLVHKKDDDGNVTALPWVEPSVVLDCSGFGEGELQQTASHGPIESLLRSVGSGVASILLPQPLAAAPFRGREPRGLGGLVGSFSDFFGAVPDEDSGDEVAFGYVAAQRGSALREFSFNAVKNTDGSIAGRFKWDYVGGANRGEGIITCMNVVGDHAWFGGTITHHSVYPDYIGLPSVFKVIDVGPVEATDRYSLLIPLPDPRLPSPLAEDYCTFAPEFPPDEGLITAESGHITVLDEDPASALYPEVLVSHTAAMPNPSVVRSVAEGVARVEPGGTILIDDGVYVTEDVVINKPVTIDEVDGAEAIVWNDTGLTSLLIDGVGSGLVSIQNLDFENLNPGGHPWKEDPTPPTSSIEIVGEYDEVIVQNNNFNTVQSTGVRVKPTTVFDATVLVDDNYFTGGLIGVLATGDDDNDPALTTAEVTVSSNTIQSPDLMCIYYNDVLEGTIQSNTLDDCGVYGGLWVFGDSQVDVLDNVITDATIDTDAVAYHNAIRLDLGVHGAVSRNTIDGCGWGSCIQIARGSVATVSGNTIRGYFDHGTVVGILGWARPHDEAPVTVTVTDNILVGEPASDPSNRPFGHAAISIRNATVPEMTGNSITNAAWGFAFQQDVVSPDVSSNVVDQVNGAVKANEFNGSLSMEQNDFTNWDVSIRDGTGTFTGSLACNWWGDEYGPSNNDFPTGSSPIVFSPWADGPVTGGGTGQCGSPVYLTDPTGDARASGPDFISATAQVTGSNLRVEIRFAEGTSGATTRVDLILDTDQNPATGYPGVDAPHNDATLIGGDYYVALGAVEFVGNRARLSRGNGAPYNNLTLIKNLEAGFELVENGMNVTIPLSDLGGDDGVMNFKAVVFTQLSTSSYTGISDYMPDLGLPVGTVN